MTWSYSGNPSNSELDKYRFAIGDTVESQPLLQDEEIEYVLLTITGNNLRLYNLFDRLAVMFGRSIKKSLGPQSEDPTSRMEFFERNRDYYKKLSYSSSGLSLPKSTPPIFNKGMHDNV